MDKELKEVDQKESKLEENIKAILPWVFLGGGSTMMSNDAKA